MTTPAVRHPRVSLVGSPNAGKTTLFNALTGLRAKTANYPGVTVTRRIGEVRVEGRTVQLEDLPGTYSLEPASPDEQVVVDSLVGADGPDARPDGLIIVADVTTLRRSLILIAQALALGLPSVLAVTMIDEFDRLGGSVDLQRLSAALGVEVVGVVPTKGRGLETVRGLLAAPGDWPVPVLPPPSEPAEMAAWIDSVLTDVVHVPSRRSPWTERVDRVLLHPVIGTLIFAVVMVTFFQIIFAWAAPLSDAIDSFFVATLPTMTEV